MSMSNEDELMWTLKRFASPAKVYTWLIKQRLRPAIQDSIYHAILEYHKVNGEYIYLPSMLFRAVRIPAGPREKQ